MSFTGAAGKVGRFVESEVVRKKLAAAPDFSRDWGV
jgi:hypothetical protein